MLILALDLLVGAGVPDNGCGSTNPTGPSEGAMKWHAAAAEEWAPQGTDGEIQRSPRRRSAKRDRAFRQLVGGADSNGLAPHPSHSCNGSFGELASSGPWGEFTLPS